MLLDKFPCHLKLKDDFQSILRNLRVCFRFCFEFVDMLHFGHSIHEVFESAITGRYVTNAR